MDRAIGHALAWWNHVETALGDVFCAIFGSINNTAARGAYLAVINFNARLQMVEAAAQAIRLESSLLEQWRVLKNKTDKKSAIRNKITHFSRMAVKGKDGEMVIYMLPNFWETDEWISAIEGKSVRYTWPEIWKFGQTFGQLAIELRRLAVSIEQYVQAHPPKFPLSTPDPTPESDTPSAK